MIIIMTTSKTWTRTLDPDLEKPGRWKTWTLKNLDAEKPGPWNTWTLKNLGSEKPGPYDKHESWETWNKYGIRNVFRELCSIMTMRNVV